MHILNGKQCRSRSVGFFRSQLIWTYTVCKGRIYPGSAGQGWSVLYTSNMFFHLLTGYIWYFFLPFCTREFIFVTSCFSPHFFLIPFFFLRRYFAPKGSIFFPFPFSEGRHHRSFKIFRKKFLLIWLGVTANSILLRSCRAGVMWEA